MAATSSSYYRIRIEGGIGDSIQGDVAIDDLSAYMDRLTTAPNTSQTFTTTTAVGAIFGGVFGALTVITLIVVGFIYIFSKKTAARFG
ncbi:unnamed protein product [Rotaria magnacalcarata]|uniref:Uncharacterized protein n=2 Tax=Rotaria magnacalcarata TaxID=392030 RepID=A0A814GND7_9BILA|nr:unnamed protein product [Rotaria magnacalcarata]CAF2039392.1 unnamed protein product [Rotaria magnacalcarata]